MQIKVIYEDNAVLPIKELIAQLDTQQLFFVEKFIQQKRMQQKQEVFQQWQTTLDSLVKKIWRKIVLGWYKGGLFFANSISRTRLLFYFYRK